jgi:hypothetical protein
MVRFIRVNGKIMKRVDMVYIVGQVGAVIRVNGKIVI